MLIGNYNYTIDVKGRIFIPAKLREDLGETIYATRGFDNCIFIFSFTEWDKLSCAINSQPFSKASKIQRFFHTASCELQIDKQGRVVLPPDLRAYAGLDKDIVITGAWNRVEVWDKARWEQINEEQNDDNAILALMDEIGF